MAALRDGAVDALASSDRSERDALFLLANEGDFAMHNGIAPTLGAIIYNWSRESTRYFTEQRVRLALDIGLDRSSAIERTLGSSAIRANSPLIPGSWAYVADLARPTYNPAEARRLLETASERFAAENAADDAPLFSFAILTPDDPALARLTQEIATQWSQLGLDVRVEIVDRATYRERLTTHDFDAALVEYALGDSADPDIYAFWHEGQYPDGLNYGGVNDRRISETLERARRDPHGINRVLDYTTFQREFIDRAIAVPIYYPLVTYVTHQRVDSVQLGYLGTLADRFRSIDRWRVID